MTYNIQGLYGRYWETVCSEETEEEANKRLQEYDENETQYLHRIVEVIE